MGASLLIEQLCIKHTEEAIAYYNMLVLTTGQSCDGHNVSSDVQLYYLVFIYSTG